MVGMLLFQLVLVIFAAGRASKGQRCAHPLSIRLIR